MHNEVARQLTVAHLATYPFRLLTGYWYVTWLPYNSWPSVFLIKFLIKFDLERHLTLRYLKSYENIYIRFMSLREIPNAVVTSVARSMERSSCLDSWQIWVWALSSLPTGSYHTLKKLIFAKLCIWFTCGLHRAAYSQICLIWGERVTSGRRVSHAAWSVSK